MGNAPSLPGLGGGRAHGMRYDDPRGSPRGHRPEGIPAVAMETQTLEQIEEESIGGDSEVEVLEPLEGHINKKGSLYFSFTHMPRSLP